MYNLRWMGEAVSDRTVNELRSKIPYEMTVMSNGRRQRCYDKLLRSAHPCPNDLPNSRTKIKHDSQLLFCLRKLLLPGFPFRRVIHEVILTIVTTNKVNRRGRTVSEQQTEGDESWSVQGLGTSNESNEQFWQSVPNSINLIFR